MKTYISKSGDGVFTTGVSLRHTAVFTYSHASTPLGQSERTYYLRYFINNNITIDERTVIGERAIYNI